MPRRVTVRVVVMVLVVSGVARVRMIVLVLVVSGVAPVRGVAMVLVRGVGAVRLVVRPAGHPGIARHAISIFDDSAGGGTPVISLARFV